VLRLLGRRAGAAVVVADVGKGIAACVVGRCLAAGATVATSQPSPAEFAAVYAAAAARGEQSVISIHLDERVSGTAGSARRSSS